MLRGSGRSQEFIQKATFKKKNGSTKISVLEVRIDSMQHFFPLFCFWCYRLSLIRVGWDGADALKLIFLRCNSVPIQPFCFYTLLWC